jgi:hypothetical protein
MLEASKQMTDAPGSLAAGLSQPAGEEKARSIRSIRIAIRSHHLSFPSQVPVFMHLHRPDIQWRIVLLYFVHGWSSGKIGARYGMTRERVMQLLRQWTSRAILRGYLGRIPSERECIT